MSGTQIGASIAVVVLAVATLVGTVLAARRDTRVAVRRRAQGLAPRVHEGSDAGSVRAKVVLAIWAVLAGLAILVRMLGH